MTFLSSLWMFWRCPPTWTHCRWNLKSLMLICCCFLRIVGSGEIISIKDGIGWRPSWISISNQTAALKDHLSFLWPSDSRDCSAQHTKLKWPLALKVVLKSKRVSSSRFFNQSLLIQKHIYGVLHHHYYLCTQRCPSLGARPKTTRRW